MHHRRRLFVLPFIALAVAVSALPAFGAGSGSVDMTVTIASPCITVGPTTPIDFGSQSFSTPSVPQSASSNAITFANCTSVPEKVLVRGTDATGGSNALWSLVTPPSQSGVMNECFNNPAPDKYSVRVEVPLGGETAIQNFNGHLTTTDTFLSTPSGNGSFQGQTTYTTLTKVLMPCTGSSGVGQTMSFQAIYTASF